MDAKLSNTQAGSSGFPLWDFVATNGKVSIIYDEIEVSQQATVTAFTQLGLLPQYKSYGVDWVGALTGNVTLNELDMSINDNLASNGKINYSPSYSFKNEQIYVNIKKPQEIRAI